MTGTAASYTLPRLTGEDALAAGVDMQSRANGAWIPTGVAVVLPRAGRYRLSGTVRGQLSVDAGNNVWLQSRLFVVQDAVVVANSERIVNQHGVSVAPAGTNVAIADNRAAAFDVFYDAPGVRTVRLEAQRNLTDGNSLVAAILPVTTLLYELVGP